MDGAMSFTVNVIVVEAEPAELFAQIVYVAVEVIVSGVPQIVPLLFSKFNPVGTLALIAQLEIPPVVPLNDMSGVTGVIVTPFVPKISE